MGERSKTHHFLPQVVLRGFASGVQVTTVDLTTRRSFSQDVDKASRHLAYRQRMAEWAAANEMLAALARGWSCAMLQSRGALNLDGPGSV